jgi:hypothetical protein
MTHSSVPLTPESEHFYSFKEHDATFSKTFFRYCLQHERRVDLIKRTSWNATGSGYPLLTQLFFPLLLRSQESPLLRQNEMVFQANQSQEICSEYLKRSDTLPNSRTQITPLNMTARRNSSLKADMSYHVIPESKATQFLPSTWRAEGYRRVGQSPKR